MDNEILQAIGKMLDEKISTILDKKLQPIQQEINSINNRLDNINNRLDNMESRLDNMSKETSEMKSNIETLDFKHDQTQKKLNNISLDIKVSERNIRKDIHKLNNETETVIEILKQNEILPR